MKLLRPIPRSVSRPLPVLILIAWVGCMALLVHRTYVQASPGNLATDLARYGPTATWRGVYYRGEKIGFTVSQTVRTDTGFELQEDARLELVLLGSTSATALRTTAKVDENFALESFAFSLDPGTGPIEVAGDVVPAARLSCSVSARSLCAAIVLCGRGVDRRPIRGNPGGVRRRHDLVPRECPAGAPYA